MHPLYGRADFFDLETLQKFSLLTHHSDKLPSVRFFEQKINECTFKLDDVS